MYSLFLAKVLGPYFVIVAMGLILNTKTFIKAIEGFKNLALLYIGAIMALIIGLLMITVHNVWVMRWEVIITIIGWLSTIKGASLMIFPTFMMKIIPIYQKNPLFLKSMGFLALVLGIVLIKCSYF